MPKNQARTEARTIDETIQACAHNISVRWWEIVGPVSDEELIDVAEEHIRESIAEDYSSGQLVHETDESSAIGWWEVKR